MGLRETMNERKGLVGAVVVAIVLFVVLLAWQTLGSHPRTAASNKAFFSDDDGKTWFADEVTKIPPFDHGGKPAYRAAVFRCGSGQPFVAWLESYSPESKAKAEQILRMPADKPKPDLPDPEVKKPGDAKWVKSTRATADQYSKITTALCPDGSTKDLEIVKPE